MFLDFLFVLAAVLFLYWLLDRAALEARGRDRLALRDGPDEARRAPPLRGAPGCVARRVGAHAGVARGPRSVLSAAVVVATAIPWRIWYVTHDVGGEGPTDGFVQGDRLRRAVACRSPRVRRALGTRLLERPRARCGRRARARRPGPSRQAGGVLRDASSRSWCSAAHLGRPGSFSSSRVDAGMSSAGTSSSVYMGVRRTPLRGGGASALERGVGRGRGCEAPSRRASEESRSRCGNRRGPAPRLPGC